MPAAWKGAQPHLSVLAPFPSFPACSPWTSGAGRSLSREACLLPYVCRSLPQCSTAAARSCKVHCPQAPPPCSRATPRPLLHPWLPSHFPFDSFDLLLELRWAALIVGAWSAQHIPAANLLPPGTACRAWRAGPPAACKGRPSSGPPAWVLTGSLVNRTFAAGSSTP